MPRSMLKRSYDFEHGVHEFLANDSKEFQDACDWKWNSLREDKQMALLKKENECHIVAHDPWELKDGFQAKHDAKLLDKPSFARDKESWSRLWPTCATKEFSKWRIGSREGCATDSSKGAATCCPKRRRFLTCCHLRARA